MISLPVARARKIIADGYDIGPRMQPCTCGAPRHAHGGTRFTGGHEPTGCRRYRRDVADALAERAMYPAHSTVREQVVAWHHKMYPRPKVREGGWGVGPSDLGTCQHKIQLRERPPTDLTTNDVDDSAAILGSIFHDIIGRARKFHMPWLHIEIPVDVPGLDRPGRADEYDPIFAAVRDYKTVGEYAWEQLGIDGPPLEHWQQVSLYGYGLACAGHDVKRVELIYVRRADGVGSNLAEALQTETFSRPYDEAFAKQALTYLTSILLALDLGEELPREGRGPTSDPVCARFCEFRDHCWNVDAAKAAGRSPESYTILGEHPEAEQIEWAAALARGWKDNETEAEREYKAAVPLLHGVPDGKYGLYLVKERGRWMPDYPAFYRTVRDAYERWLYSDEQQRADFGTILANISLPKRRDVWTEVKRVRVADHPDQEDAA